MQKEQKFYVSEGIYGIYDKFKSFIRFSIVGVINTLVDFSVFAMFHSLFGVDKLICQVAGYSMGVVNSFILNKFWTFENSNSKFNTINQMVRFIGINLVSLAISLLGLKLISDWYGLGTYVSKVIVTIMAQAVNYFGYKLLVFKSKT